MVAQESTCYMALIGQVKPVYSVESTPKRRGGLNTDDTAPVDAKPTNSFSRYSRRGPLVPPKGQQQQNTLTQVASGKFRGQYPEE
mmetsp:Transcript_13026/g.22041  ORF Transcript_13026/g.22041 Transcript_13026/m.22041 type:complete len:85 (-) Transcript_13026:696-950(-)